MLNPCGRLNGTGPPQLIASGTAGKRSLIIESVSQWGWARGLICLSYA